MATSSRLRGITITIGGDTTELNKAMKDVDAQAGSLQHELTEVSRLLRMDPGNMELIAQQQELYNQQLDTSQERLQRLRSVESQMQEQFRSGTIGEEQMRSYQRELIRAEQGVNRARQAIEDFNQAANNSGANAFVADLAAIDQRSGALQNELRAVNNLLQLDPGNADLLAQQQLLYNQQLENSRERLQRLRQEESQMQEQLQSGQIGEEQMRAFQREIVSTEQSIRQTENALNGLDDTIDDAGDSADEFTEKFNSGLKLASAAVVAVGAAAIGGGVMAMDEMQKALNQLQVATGSTNEEMSGFKESIKEIYKANVGESFDDIALAMSEVKQQTGLTGEELEGATKNALMMRDVFDLDINEGVRGVNALMKQFGVDSEQAYNMIAIGAQNGLNQNQDLADQLGEYSVYYSEMGFSAEEMFGAMASGVETGVFQIDLLNNAMKEFGLKSKDGSDATKQAFADLGLVDMTDDFAAGGDRAKEAFATIVNELSEMGDKTKQNAIGVALFGTAWEDNGLKAMEALMNVDNKLDLTKDAMGEMAAIKYDSFGEALAGIGRQIQTDLLIPIGDALLPALNMFAGILQLLMAHMNIIGPILVGLGAGLITFTIATQAQTVALQAQAVAQGLVNAVMGANPIALVITALVALTAVFATLWTTNETFRNGMIELWGVLKDFLAETLGNIGECFSTTWDGIKLVFDTFIKLFRGDFSGFLSGLVTIITEAIPNIFRAGASIFTGLWDGMKSVWEGISGWIDGTIDWLADKLSFWKDSQSEMSEGGADGSHAKGLNYVPFDGYKAILHQGEAVLTANENRAYQSGVGSRSGGDFNVTQNIYSPTSDPAAIERQAERRLRKLGLGVRA